MVKNSLDPSINTLCDNHVHTHLCGHAKGTMEEYVQAGIANGLKKIIFLEHMEEGIRLLQNRTWLTEDEFDSYFDEGQRLQNKYLDEIEIGLGVECGYNPLASEKLKQRLADRKWDQVGISCHFLEITGLDHHLNMFSRIEENIQLARKLGPEQLLSRYFDTLIEAVQELPGSMLCHLDGPLRHLPELTLTGSHYKQIDQLLRLVAEHHMALELNSSGFTIRGEQFPREIILKMAKAYKIPFLCSSDAHKPDDVGNYFDRLAPLLPA